jgi:hypothetical protein
MPWTAMTSTTQAATTHQRRRMAKRASDCN